MYIFEILKVFNEPDFFLKKNILFVFFLKSLLKKCCCHVAVLFGTKNPC